MEIVALPLPGTGMIGLAACPGRRGALAHDVAAVREWGATQVVSLVDDAELARLGAAGLGDALNAVGIRWWRMPIPDMQPPGGAAIAGWQAATPALRATWRAGGRVLLHCAAGLGRTGTVAAWALCAHGVAPEAAIAAVRQIRPGAIETAAQEAFLRAGPPGFPDGP